MKTFTASRGIERNLKFQVNDHVFSCRNTLPAGVLLQFAEAMGEMSALEGDNPDGEDTDAGGAAGFRVIGVIKDLFQATLVPESYERFNVLLNDPDEEVDINLLTEIAGWITEQFTSRPTQSPSVSSSSGRTPGDDSTGGRSPEALTYSRPEPEAAPVTPLPAMRPAF